MRAWPGEVGVAGRRVDRLDSGIRGLAPPAWVTLCGSASRICPLIYKTGPNGRLLMS